MTTIQEMEVQLQSYNQLQMEIKNLEEQSSAIRTRVNELLTENELSDYESNDGVSVMRFTPKPQNRLNKGLVESFCNEKNLDIKSFYKQTSVSEQIKILIPDSKKKMEKYLKPKEVEATPKLEESK